MEKKAKNHVRMRVVFIGRRGTGRSGKKGSYRHRILTFTLHQAPQLYVLQQR